MRGAVREPRAEVLGGRRLPLRAALCCAVSSSAPVSSATSCSKRDRPVTAAEPPSWRNFSRPGLFLQREEPGSEPGNSLVHPDGHV